MIDTASAPLEVTDAQLREVALTRAEYVQICERLGRAPNAVELGMCGAMWSERFTRLVTPGAFMKMFASLGVCDPSAAHLSINPNAYAPSGRRRPSK